MARLTAPLNMRIPQVLMDLINAQMAAERRSSKSEMVRILIEDGLQARQSWLYSYQQEAAREREKRNDHKPEST